MRGAQSVLGLLLALGVAEAIFWWRDRGAFPHVNFYLPDATLGVRLRPGATERISFGGNPVTRVRINRDGFRGPDLPLPAADEVLVVGDSQVFGLGVEDDATFSARLGAALGRPVVNAGVPTYGPEEYDAVIAEMLARRHAKTVVYVVNFSNDLFEASHPNRNRHVVLDGWAVRRDIAPPPSRSFPGRAWLLGQSHLVYAARRFYLDRGKRAEDLDHGVASEGSWTDLLDAERAARQTRAAARREIEVKTRALGDEQDKLVGKEEALERKLYRKTNIYELIEPVPEEMNGFRLEIGRAAVGDILRDDSAEEGRSVVVTADLLRQAAELRNRVEATLRERAESAEKGTARNAQKALGIWNEWRRVAKQRDELMATPARFLRHQSPLLPHVQRAKQLCDAAGARLVVVALPVDVMVSAEEWKKYGATPVDLGATRVLVDDLTRASEEIGVSALDATAALAGAEPGAFLNHDLHMSSRGHQALATALAAKLAEPPPPPLPTGEHPPDRHRPPDPNSWSYLEGEPPFEGDKPEACRIGRLAEWIRVFCYRDNLPAGSTVRLLRGGRGDGMTFSTDHSQLLLAPLLPGDSLTAELRIGRMVQRLDVRQEAGTPDPMFTFRDPVALEAAHAEPSPRDQARRTLEAKLLRCMYPDPKKRRDPYEYGYVQVTADLDCEATYGDDCLRGFQCARGDPAFPARLPARTSQRRDDQPLPPAVRAGAALSRRAELQRLARHAHLRVTAMLRASIARILNPIVWRLPGRGARMLFSFAHAEAASRLDLLAAARHTPSPERRALYLRHALDEARHATVFAHRSAELRRAGGRRSARCAPTPSALRAPGRDALPRVRPPGEARGRRQFEGYSASARAPATTAARAVRRHPRRRAPPRGLHRRAPGRARGRRARRRGPLRARRGSGRRGGSGGARAARSRAACTPCP